MDPLDPAPRRYPPGLTLLRRRACEVPATDGAMGTMTELEEWLLGDAVAVEDMLTLCAGFVGRAVAAGLPLDRVTVHIGTLHPQVVGFSWSWYRSDGLCDELRIDQSVQTSDAYRWNPLFQVIEQGRPFHARTDDEAASTAYPLLRELAAQGIVDYLAAPLRAGGAYHNAVTMATAAPEGFGETPVAVLRPALRLLALHLERHIALRIAANVLDTYLGPAAGGRVLHGQIKRGEGAPIRSVVWMSDMRGFTSLSDRLEGGQVIAILNAYFERLAGAVLSHGGEVLKFIGDGLLAVFPLASFADERAAAAAALAAARGALAGVEALNAAPPPPLDRIAGWHPLQTGIALHAGDVFFGNVGAAERLDFTVIGPAVNAAARVEALSKVLGRSILVTRPVAERLDEPLDDLGDHLLRGVAEPIRLFGPPL